MPTELQNIMIPHNKPTIGAEEIRVVANALGNLELTIGTKVKKFERAFSNFIGVDSAATSSGTAALHLALIVLGVQKNDEVILPTYTCKAVAMPVLYQQGKTILADITDDYNISVEDIKKKVTDKTKAVIVPHMFGYPADLNEIKELCEKNNVYLVEDCAQAIGATYQGKKVGSIGDISIFSFYATKMMTTIQGGMVCTKNLEWIQAIKDLRYHDKSRSLEDNDLRIGYSYILSDIGAAMGIIQLKKLNSFIKRRKEIAAIYRKNLAKEITQPVAGNGREHVYFRYVIRTSNNPQEVIKKIRMKKIKCERMHFPPLHKRALLRRFNNKNRFFKTDEIVNSAVSLPIYPSLTDAEAIYIADSVNKSIRLL